MQRGQRLEFPVAPGRHEIFLKIDWCTSPVVEIEAQPGEVIELSCRAGGPAATSLLAVVFASRRYISLTR